MHNVVHEIPVYRRHTAAKYTRCGCSKSDSSGSTSRILPLLDALQPCRPLLPSLYVSLWTAAMASCHAEG